METKVCHKCHEQKPLDQFKKDSRGYQLNECNECKSEYHKAYKAKRKELEGDNPKRKRIVRSKETPLGKCIEKGCIDPAVEFRGLTKYCKSHALDILIFDKSVQLSS